MADIHVEEFYRDVAIALSQLYSAFPRRINLFVEDIAGPDEPDEFGLHSKRHMACFGALLWLAEEGFLRYVDTIRQEALDQAVLTGTPSSASAVRHRQPWRSWRVSHPTKASCPHRSARTYPPTST